MPQDFRVEVRVLIYFALAGVVIPLVVLALQPRTVAWHVRLGIVALFVS